MMSFNKSSKKILPSILTVFSLCLLTFSVPALSQEDSTTLGWENPINDSGNGYISSEFGTFVSPVLGNAHWRSVDLHVPLNGPDITIARKLTTKDFYNLTKVYTPTEIFDWSLDVPKIQLNYWGASDTSALAGCNVPGVKNVKVSIEGASEFDPVGMTDSGISYPNNTVIHFANNWLLLCESFTTRGNSVDENGSSLTPFHQNKIVLLSPEGTKYHFGVDAKSDLIFKFTSIPKTWDVTLIKTLSVTDIEDRFGNWLAFDYKKVVLNTYSTQLLLTGVRSKEGVSVSLQNDGNDITGITYNGKTVTYSPMDMNWSYPPYNPRLLSEVTIGGANDSETWTYIHEEFGDAAPSGAKIHRGLKKVQNPWGGQIELDYKARIFACSQNEIAWPIYDYYVSQTTISGNNIDTYSVIYDVWRDLERNAQGAIISPEIAETKVTYPDRIEHYQYHCAHFVSNYVSDIRDHRMRQVDLMDLEENVVSTTEYQWLEQSFSHVPEYVWHDSNSANRLVLEKKIIDGEYETVYSDYDAFGNARLFHEKQLVSAKEKYTKNAFSNDAVNWLIGLPVSTKVSKTNSNFTEVESTSYHTDTVGNSAYADLALPYETKRFGRWLHRATEYHSDGNIKKVEFNALRTVGAGRRFRLLENYKHGQPESLTIPAPSSSTNISATRVINNDGLVESITDFDNVKTSFAYNDLNRIIAVTHQTDSTFSHDWLDSVYTWSTDASGAITRKEEICEWNIIKNGSGNPVNLDVSTAACKQETAELSRTFTYDGLFRLIQSHESNGTKNRYQNYGYDFANRTTFTSFWSSSSNESRGSSTTYNERGRKRTESISGLGTTTHEYLSGNKIRTTDGKGYVTNKEFLAYGEPEYSQFVEILSPEQVTTEINVDEFGLTNSITQKGLGESGQQVSITEHFEYDTYKQLCLTRRPDIGNTLYSRNALGEILWSAEGVTNTACTSTKPSAAITYTLDNFGQIKNVNYSDSSPDVTFTRDNNGNITKLVSGDVEQDYFYNNKSLLEGEALKIGTEKQFALDYVFNNLAHGESIGYPDGTVVKYSPNSFGEPTAAQLYIDEQLDVSYASNVNFYANGRIDSFTYGNGLTHKTKIGFILHDLPSEIEDSSATTKAIHNSFGYDSNANLATINDLKDTSYSLSNITYDGLGRLTGMTGGSGIGSSSIQYDSLGNIIYYSSKNRVLDYNYNYTSNRLNSVSSTGIEAKPYSSFAYDARGNITNNSYHGFTYNQANQMIASGSKSYIYDGHNRRVKQSDSKGVTYSMYSQAGRLLYRETPKGGIKYIYLNKRLIAKDGAIEESSPEQHFRPYGGSLEGEIDDVGYTGHKFDTDLGLSYMQARYYDPVLGRFYANDPVNTLGHMSRNNLTHGFNRYTYANNNPYKYTDPDGKFVLQAVGALIGGIQAFQAVKNSGANWTDKALAVTAGAIIGGVTGGRASAAVATVATKIASSKAAQTVVATSAGGIVGGTSGATAQVTADVLTGQPVTAEKTANATINGVVSGAIGGAPAKTGVAVASTVITETILQAGSALADEMKEQDIVSEAALGQEDYP